MEKLWNIDLSNLNQEVGHIMQFKHIGLLHVLNIHVAITPNVCKTLYLWPH